MRAVSSDLTGLLYFTYSWQTLVNIIAIGES